jgi:hypothetical protein
MATAVRMSSCARLSRTLRVFNAALTADELFFHAARTAAVPIRMASSSSAPSGKPPGAHSTAPKAGAPAVTKQASSKKPAVHAPAVAPPPPPPPLVADKDGFFVFYRSPRAGQVRAFTVALLFKGAWWGTYLRWAYTVAPKMEATAAAATDSAAKDLLMGLDVSRAELPQGCMPADEAVA